MISNAVNNELSYDKDHITSKAWDFFDNKIENIIFEKIKIDIDEENIEDIDDIDEDMIEEYMQAAIEEFEVDCGRIRDYT